MQIERCSCGLMQRVVTLALLSTLGVLAACSNGRGSVASGEAQEPPPQQQPPPTDEEYTIGGTVTGLEGSGLVLQLNGGADLEIEADGTFVFPDPLLDGSNYRVTVLTQPADPEQTCAVRNGSGALEGADVTNIEVVCSNDDVSFTVGGTVTGLVGTGLVLQNNGGDDLPIEADGTFAFATPIPHAEAYEVTVRSQPQDPAQICTVANASGTIQGADVDNVVVACSSGEFTIGGTVTGLQGSGLVLQLNGNEDLEIASNGAFTFATQFASGSDYEVTIASQPTDPAQTCTVADGSGTVSAADVRTVRVTCATNTYRIRGNVSGLLGEGLVLENNGGDPIEVASDGAFEFPSAVSSGAQYDVEVRTQPSDPTQACTVANGSGVVEDSDVTSISVTCTTSEFSIGGRVSGLEGTGLVLRNNGGDDLAVDSNGAFEFDTPIPSGATYDVTIAAQPSGPTQTCTVANASGTVGGGPVTSIEIDCVTVEYTVGGTVTGLAGSGLVLQNNGADDLPIAANGGFTFGESLPSGTPYGVTVAAQPSEPTQVCEVANGTGTIGDADVNDVAVTCTTSRFAIRVAVSGMSGFALRVQNNGAEILTINADGIYTFPTPIESGSGYSVILLNQPIFGNGFCVLQNGIGTVGASDVTVSVVCD